MEIHYLVLDQHGGYKLYENETNRFLKNGITSRKISETRYAKNFMKDKHMKHF